MASASFFNVIKASPVVGRYFSDDEDRRGADRVVVISEALWRRRYQASPSVLGSPVQIDGEQFTVIGVAPSGFSEVWRLDVWVPLGLTADPANRGSNYLLSFGRLRDGMTLAAARRGLEDLAAQMSRENAIDKYTFTARPLHEVITENATRGLWMLLAATGLLLMIACTNVANLLLARAVVRERDLAVRASLGAGRRRLFGQVMGETDRARHARERCRYWPCLGSIAHLRGAGSRELPKACSDQPGHRRPRLLIDRRRCRRSDRRPRSGDSPASLRSEQRDSFRRQSWRHRRPRTIRKPSARDHGSRPRAGVGDDGGVDGEELVTVAVAGPWRDPGADADVRYWRAAVCGERQRSGQPLSAGVPHSRPRAAWCDARKRDQLVADRPDRQQRAGAARRSDRRERRRARHRVPHRNGSLLRDDGDPDAGLAARSTIAIERRRRSSPSSTKRWRSDCSPTWNHPPWSVSTSVCSALPARPTRSSVSRRTSARGVRTRCRIPRSTYRSIRTRHPA